MSGALRRTNAKVVSTGLGAQEGRGLHCWLHLSWEGTGGSFGGDHWDATDEPVASLPHFIKRVLDTVGVESWEQLPGRFIRIEHDGTKVYRIGHIVEDRWFDPSAEAERSERQRQPTAGS